ncbi:MAG: Ig-like domain-containing protein, partial [Thermoplasmata archaeon]|nr:Ig-like domain-containing protein [Thermoplasmata archaeon]
MVLLSLLIVSGLGALFLQSNLQAVSRGSGDGNIAGTVEGGGAGMLVEATATNVSGGPLKFTGLTLADGSFNITVDANPEFITPYMVEVSPNYHYDVGSRLYMFTRENDNETQHVPAGMLTASRVLTSNLTVTVLNGSSMEPLPGARFEVSYGGEVPEPEFELVSLTDQYGNISIADIRSGETSVNLSKLNFKYLEGSGLPETIEILEGGHTNLTLVLEENDWPFETVPGGRTDDFTISSNITVNFGAIMEHGTIDTPAAYKLRMVADGSLIPIAHEVSGDDMSVQIDPQVDLEYNTTYMFWMENSVKLEVGPRPLWRPMEVFFTTELIPTTVSGYVREQGTGQPVEGVAMTLNELRSLTDDAGMYSFPAVPPGDYTAFVEGSYLHGSAYGVNITAAKGEAILMEDILVDPFPFGSLEVNVLSDLGPVEGAWVSVRGSSLNITTNGTGSALIEKVREGMATIKVGDDHHLGLEEERFIYEGGLSYLNISLLERPFPITVEPTDEITPGVVDVGTDLLIHMPGPVQFTTLVVSLISLNDNGTVDREVLLNQITQVGTSNTYKVDPLPLLELETSYLLIIGSGLRLIGEDENLIW